MANAGFDASTYPGDSTMTWLLANTNLEWCGYYLAPAPSHTDASWVGKRAFLQNAGWQLAPLYVGQQAVGPGSHILSAAQGTTDGQDAVHLAADEGFSAGAVIYLDIEQGPPIEQDALDYCLAWVEAVWESEYYPGLYCSYLLAAQLNAADSRPLLWCFNIDHYPNGTEVSAPFPSADPAGCGYADATIWQLSQNNFISAPDGTIQVDLDTATSSEPGMSAVGPTLT